MFSVIALFLYNWLLLIYICTCIFYFSSATFDHWKDQKIPFKKPAPVFGNIAAFVFGFKSYNEMLHDLYVYFGDSPFGGFFQIREPVLLVRDAELVNKILVENANVFFDRAFNFLYPDKQLNPLSTLLFMAKGDRARVIRKKLTPVFVAKKLRLIQGTILDLLTSLDKVIDDKMVNGEVDIDLIDPFRKYMTDLVGKWSLGIDCSALKGNDEFQVMTEKLVRTPVYRLLVLTMPFKVRRWLKLTDFPPSATEFYRKVILDAMVYRRKNGVIKNDVLQQLIELQNSCFDPQYAIPELQDVDMEDGCFDEIDVCATTFSVIFGGIEEAAVSIAHCLYELTLHENVRNELLKEVESAFKANNQTLSLDWVENLEYMDAVVTETLRKYPVIPWLVRTNTEDYQIPNTDKVIAKNTAWVIPVWSIHHDERYYPNPDQFDPMRFYGEKKTAIRNGTFCTFGDGPRKCLGQQFTYFAMKMGITNILLKYELAVCPKTEIPLTFRKAAVTMAVSDGVWIRIKKREM